MPTTRHKVFLSFHDELDFEYRRIFQQNLAGDIVDRSVNDGDIDPALKVDTVRGYIRDRFIADATVTVVLVGQCTWQRKHVDWEIGSSLRHTSKNPRCGLLGILLPTHPDFRNQTFRKNLIPPRLADNAGFDGSFAKIYDWPQPWDSGTIRVRIREAFERRHRATPNNARRQFSRNRSGSCSDGWSG